MKKSLGPRTLVYPTPVFVIGTYDKTGKANVMTAAWAGICCSAPPCIGVSLRKATYTFGNILDRKAFTVNIPSEDYIKEADFFGIASGREIDKFAAAGLTPAKSDLVDAPYVKEFPLVLECKLIKTIEIGLHTQFIGEIVDVKAEENVLGPDDLPEMEKVKPALFAPETRKYYGAGKFLGKAFSIGREL
ncbi:MAG: flavin reductase family protein [Methanotrichaceae archaeon]|nr:flavin reductase family protein [Methanotrichaceae archaeon]